MASVLRRVGLLVAILATVGCDHVSKQLATTLLAGRPDRSFLGGIVRLVYAENPGGFLSLGAELPPLMRRLVFTLGTGLAIAGLLVLLWSRAAGGVRALGLALFAAGGMSNWIDRLLWGRVVDFMNVGVGPVRTGIFNVADVAIVLGAGLWLVAEFWPSRTPPAS